MLSAREWETELVTEAHTSASIRLVLRAYRPQDIDDRADEIDAVVAGAETSWITPAVIARWKRRGLGVLGLHPPADAPARRLLEDGDADAVLADDSGASEIVRTLLTLERRAAMTPLEPLGTVVAVTGPRGAPGRTEVSFGLAWLWSKRRSTVHIDLDLAAPAMAIRAGLPPRPHLGDAAEALRHGGRLDPHTVHRLGSLRLVVTAAPSDALRLPLGIGDEVIGAAADSFDIVVLDVPSEDRATLKAADATFVVAEASSIGIVRAASLLADWKGATPHVVLNRVVGAEAAATKAALRQWTGSDAVACVPYRRSIRSAAIAGRSPDRALLRPLRHLEARP